MMTTRALAPLALAVLLAFGLAAAAQDAADPPMIEQDDEDGNFLVIPGIGKIPMPPGTRAFGPGNRPRLGPERQGPRAAAPPPPPTTPEQKQAEEMGRLYARLAEAEDEKEAQFVAAEIIRRWSRSGSDTIDLLAARAVAAEAAGSATLARALIDYVVALSPYWSEGFVRRARLREAQGDVAGALTDLEQAARIEPKRFDALTTLGALAEKAGDKRRALDAYRRALALSPKLEALRKTQERLKVEVEGRDI